MQIRERFGGVVSCILTSYISSKTADVFHLLYPVGRSVTTSVIVMNLLEFIFVNQKGIAQLPNEFVEEFPYQIAQTMNELISFTLEIWF